MSLFEGYQMFKKRNSFGVDNTQHSPHSTYSTFSSLNWLQCIQITQRTQFNSINITKSTPLTQHNQVIKIPQPNSLKLIKLHNCIIALLHYCFIALLHWTGSFLYFNSWLSIGWDFFICCQIYTANFLGPERVVQANHKLESLELS